MPKLTVATCLQDGFKAIDLALGKGNMSTAGRLVLASPTLNDIPVEVLYTSVSCLRVVSMCEVVC